MASVQDAVASLEDGVVLTRYYLKKRPERLTFRVRLETRELIWIKSETQLKPDGTVDLRLLKEVRLKDADDKETKEFDRLLTGTDPKLCFSLHYGDQFVLKHLSLQAQSHNDLSTLLEGLQHLKYTTQNASFSSKIDRWLRKQFYELKGWPDTVTLADVKKWLAKSYCKVGNNKLKDYFREFGLNPDGLVSFECFALVYHRIMHPSKHFGDYFDHYTKHEPSGLSTVSPEKFAEFLTTENREKLDVDSAAGLMAQLLNDTARSAGNVKFTSHEFLDYLFSSDNSIWDENTTKLYQDMDQPLSHYFIASSHNTYLQGDQFMSNSSMEAYIQCLRMGARCIELDCWDGPDGYPQIFHGRTLTSKVKFVDVVKGIKKYAWQFSEYPIILSIENHCNLQQQKTMAEVFATVLGDELLTTLVDRGAERLPSPNQLKRKFIIKHKKLDQRLGYQEDMIELADMNQSDLSNSLKTGLLYLQDPVNQEEWNHHFFMLTNTGLYFTDQTPERHDEDDDDNLSLSGLELNGNTENVPVEHRHVYEPWYHGRLVDGRTTGDELLKANQHLGPAAFLVRESESFPGSFTLSFWQHDKANHCRIKSRNEGGRMKYFLVENLKFNSLCELIDFYKQNKLRSQNFELCLREPVPKVPSPKGKDWYHENLERREAEDWLARIPKDGAFLIRKRGPPDGNCALSFRAENKIKHCRIMTDHSSFSIGSATFDSLPELVAYYQKHPLYRNMKLRYAVNQALVDKCGQMDSSEVSIYGCGIYTQPNEVQTSNIQCRSLYDREPDRSDELRLRKGDLIINVIKRTPDWWQGECGEQSLKWFPSNHVEQIEDGLGSLQQGSISFNKSIKCIPRGTSMASTSDSIEDKKLYSFELLYEDGAEKIKIAADTAQEVQEWMVEINETTQRATIQVQVNKDLQKRFQIAQELSDLVVYCRTTPYMPEGGAAYFDMTSFSEIKAEKICAKKDNKGKQFLNFNMVQLSRIYPKGQRIDSSNYDPVMPWSCGSQLLALNYQTPDKAMQINQGRFMQNGMCGYVLQPSCLNDSIYDPFEKRSLVNVSPMTISLIILAGRHLFRSGKGIPSPFVEVEVLGAYYEDTKKFKTDKKITAPNALMTVWNEATDFDIVNPDLAMIRFCVQDEDVFGDPNFLGQATIPIRCIKPGYRSIPLLNEYSEELELSSLLVKIEIVNPNETEYSSIYSTLSDLRDEKRTIEEKFIENPDKVQQVALQQKLKDLNSRIDEQLDHRRKRTIGDSTTSFAQGRKHGSHQ